MSRHLPDLIDPLAWVDKGWRWQGKVPLARLPRLVRMIVNPDSEAEVDLTFARKGQVAAITGKVCANLEVVCQRCLEPLRIDVCSAVNLGVVSSIDEGNRLPEPYEPLLLEQARIPFGDIVEDELILAIPPIPRHAHCEPIRPRSGEVKAEVSKCLNPFAEFKIED